MIDRCSLGERMLRWHWGQGDPVYAVGSFYVSGSRYPRRSVVSSALGNLQSELRIVRTMLHGETILVERFGKQVSLQVFAGYSERDLRRRNRELTRIVRALKAVRAEDYQ